MVLWVDRYRPRSLAKLDFDPACAEKLKRLASSGDFGHLLVYGPPGAGKKTRVNCFLKEVYGAGVEKLRIEQQHFTTPSNKKLELPTVASNYHIEVNPADVGIHDRVVVQELIKTVASTNTLTTVAGANGSTPSARSFKTVVVNDVDRLSRDAQAALRRTMEKYVATCRLILVCGSSTSRVIEPIRSRCLSIRVEAPSEENIVKMINHVIKKEGLSIPDELCQRIAANCERNARRALLMTEAAKVQQYPFTPDQKLDKPDWQKYIEETAQMILSQQSAKKLLEVRGRLYELLCHCIPPELIIRYLAQELIKSSDQIFKVLIIKEATKFEHRIQLGNKPIFHLEAFVAKFMAAYSASLNNLDFDWQDD